MNEVANETVEVKEIETKGIPAEYKKAAMGIIERLPRGKVAVAILFDGKKDYAIDFIVSGKLNPAGPSAVVILNKLYDGAVYKSKSKNGFETRILDPDKELIDETFKQVPEEEYVVNATSRPKVGINKAQVIRTIKSMKLAGVSLDMAISVLTSSGDATEEEVRSVYTVEE